MINRVSRKRDQTGPLVYAPSDFKTGLSITLKLWHPTLQEMGVRDCKELGDGMYYFEISDVVDVGSYIGLITEHRTLHSKHYALVLDITL